MAEKYLQSLIDGLKRKLDIMNELIVISENQQHIVSASDIDWEAFDRSIDEKDVLIQQLEKLDEGFQVLFDRIKAEVNANRDKYKTYILELQGLIKQVTEKSTSLMALEQRTKAKVTSGFGTQRQRLKQNKESSKVVNSYYNSMNRMNYIDPQLMDTKK